MKDYIEWLLITGHMQYLNLLKDGNGILLLKHIAKIIPKSYSQVTRDIKKLEALNIVTINTLDNKEKLVTLNRKYYKDIFNIDKRIKNDSVYSKSMIESNFLKAYVYNLYDVDKHTLISSLLYKKYFINNSSIFTEKYMGIFKIFNDKCILFHDYNENLNLVRIIIFSHNINKRNCKSILKKIEEIYHFFYIIGLDKITIDATIVTYKSVNINYILNQISKYKTKIDYYANRDLSKIIELNFFNNIDFKFIEDI